MYDCYNSYYLGDPEDENSAAFQDANRIVENLPGENKDIGTRWSVAFKLNAYMGVAYVVQSVILAIGVYFYPLRLLGLTLQPFFCLANLAAVIVTAIFRFNDFGTLASLSISGAQYGTNSLGNPIFDTTRTYADDGQMLLRLWIIGMVYLMAQCCLGCFSGAPPTQSDMRKWGYEFEKEERDESGKLIVRSSL